MTEPDAGAAATLRAAAEVFVPGPPHDPSPGAADVGAERFLAHYLELLMPGLAAGVPALLDDVATARAGKRFAELTLDDREAVLDAIEKHENEAVRPLPGVLGLLAVAAVYGEWSGQDENGDLVARPLGWTLAGFEGPSRGRAHLLRG